MKRKFQKEDCEYMTIEEAKKFKEYKFFLNGVENLIDESS